MPNKNLLLYLLIHSAAVATDLPGLHYSGETSWESGTGILTFKSNGSMQETMEDFHWFVPTQVRRIIIERGVTVRGGFRVSYRDESNPLHIEGKDRDTSVIYGTNLQGWTAENKIAENEKWQYGAVSVLADALVYVSNLTSENPRGYNISGYANKAVIHVSRCNLIDSRGGDNNNSDGFIGAAGSSISDSLISTSDDGIKIYRDMTIKNVIIEQHRNGAPIQLGWGGENQTAHASIENLIIKGIDPQHRYNMAPFTWEGGNTGIRNLSIKGLRVEILGNFYDETHKSWKPVGLFELKPKTCTLNAKISHMRAEGLAQGVRNTQGTITVDCKNL